MFVVITVVINIQPNIDQLYTHTHVSETLRIYFSVCFMDGFISPAGREVCYGGVIHKVSQMFLDR